MTYSYGTLGELKEAVLPNGDIITYRHNANNQRVAKLKNGEVIFIIVNTVFLYLL